MRQRRRPCASGTRSTRSKSKPSAAARAARLLTSTVVLTGSPLRGGGGRRVSAKEEQGSSGAEGEPTLTAPLALALPEGERCQRRAPGVAVPPPETVGTHVHQCRRGWLGRPWVLRGRLPAVAVPVPLSVAAHVHGELSRGRRLCRAHSELRHRTSVLPQRPPQGSRRCALGRPTTRPLWSGPCSTLWLAAPVALLAQPRGDLIAACECRTLRADGRARR